MSTVATLPLFMGFDMTTIRQGLINDLQGRSLAYVDGYTVGCISALETCSVASITENLETIKPQSNNSLALFIHQKLVMFRRYLPEYSEVTSKKLKIDMRPQVLPEYRPVSDAKTPDFVQGLEAGKTDLLTLCDRYIQFFRASAILSPPPAPWVADTEYRKHIDKLFTERDEKLVQVEPIKPTV